MVGLAVGLFWGGCTVGSDVVGALDGMGVGDGVGIGVGPMLVGDDIGDGLGASEGMRVGNRVHASVVVVVEASVLAATVVVVSSVVVVNSVVVATSVVVQGVCPRKSYFGVKKVIFGSKHVIVSHLWTKKCFFGCFRVNKGGFDLFSLF